MASHKNSILLVAISLAIVASIVVAEDYVIGQRENGDSEVCHYEVDIDAQEDVLVNAERSCNPGDSYNITYINAQDHVEPHGRGGYTEITKGGVGRNNATFFLWSQRSKPLNFTISVFAKIPTE